MAVPFLDHTDPRTLAPAHSPARRPARPTLVVLEGGRSAAASRRRRVFLVRRLAAAAVAATIVAAVVLGGSALIGSLGSDAAVPASYEVVPGDTLWSIAGSLGDGGADRRQVVALLASANGGSTVVVPGQHLVIPAAVADLVS